MAEDFLDLNVLRRHLIQMEDSIIFAMIERAIFPLNNLLYVSSHLDDVALITPVSAGFPSHSCLTYFLHHFERLNASLGFYSSTVSFPFSSPASLPPSLFPPSTTQPILHSHSVTINRSILDAYITTILPLLSLRSSFSSSSSSSFVMNQEMVETLHRDVNLLSLLSKRIHYGLYVAESKYRSQKDLFDTLISKKDGEGIMRMLTDEKQEEKVLARVSSKVSQYARDFESQQLKVPPNVVVRVYKDLIIPMTKQVELEYLLSRLN